MGWFDLAGAQSGWVPRGDALDQDCNGADTDDADSDGYIAESCGGDDCNDANSWVNPGQDDDRADGYDVDCDGHDGPLDTGDTADTAANPDTAEAPNGTDSGQARAREDCAGGCAGSPLFAMAMLAGWRRRNRVRLRARPQPYSAQSAHSE